VSETKTKKDLWDRLLEKWWVCVLLGVLTIVLTCKQFQDLRALENGDAPNTHVTRRTRVLYTSAANGWSRASVARSASS